MVAWKSNTTVLAFQTHWEFWHELHAKFTARVCVVRDTTVSHLVSGDEFHMCVLLADGVEAWGRS